MACGAFTALAPASSLVAADVLLAGSVTSQAEGAMEGVLVTAQRAGSPISLTVVTDAQGRYAFPPERLAAGAYALRVRAEGYDLTPNTRVAVEVGRTTQADLTLTPTQDRTDQITNAEWLASIPGSDEDKRPLIECMSCHTLERVVTSTHDSDEWVATLRRMANYANNTTQARPQLRASPRDVAETRVRPFADYLATVNRSKGAWAWSVQRLPRPTGASTRMLVTEYALPRATIAPHDVRKDSDGYVWWSDFVENKLGRLDPRDGAVTEFAYAALKPGAPEGGLDLEPDARGDLWIALMFQNGLAKFDKRAGAFTPYPMPAPFDDDAAQQSMVAPAGAGVDGKVWTNDVARQTILRFDPASGAVERFDPFVGARGSHAPYGMVTDAQNDLWFMDFGGESVGRIDAATGGATLYPTPTPRSRPRRVMSDGAHLWFAEFAANKLAMFDMKAERFEEWDAPIAHAHPYDVFLDRQGMLWSGDMASDRVIRLDPKTGASVAYLLPHAMNIRRIFVDDTTDPPSFWAGGNHSASILKLELLEGARSDKSAGPAP